MSLNTVSWQRKGFSLFLASLTFLGRMQNTVAAIAPSIIPVQKPLQFVMLAFDGSEIKQRWEETRAFGKANNVKFTYFISGVMFVGRNRSGAPTKEDAPYAYWGPEHKPGYSDIGFSTYKAGNTNEVQPLIIERIQEMNAAKAEGHELGSHLNGHFDGSAWTEADWDQEIGDFNKLVFSPKYDGSKHTFASQPFDRSKYIDLSKMNYRLPEIVGFRAPLLSQNKNLYPILEKYHYVYDTSKVSQPNYWPEKIVYTPGQPGIWNFPLAQLNLYNRQDWQQLHTLTMDYNFWVSQQTPDHRSNPIDEPDPKKQAFLQQQMLDTYRAYFKSNYDGNRAPINIGHHFALWNHGIYWAAMQQFAKEVCNLRDVRCITYSEFVKFMEALSPTELRAYRAGAFQPGLPVLAKNSNWLIPKSAQKERMTAQFVEKQNLDMAFDQIARLDGIRNTLSEKEKRQVDHFKSIWSAFRLTAENDSKRVDRDSYDWLKLEDRITKFETKRLELKSYREQMKAHNNRDEEFEVLLHPSGEKDGVPVGTALRTEGCFPNCEE